MIKTALALVPLVLAACGSRASEPTSTATPSALHHGGAGSSSGSTGSDVVVACANGADATATCSGGDHCCFTNYNAEHDGYCSSAPCFYGTIACDGPEDCGAGESCCMAALVDPIDGTYGYAASCRTGACADTPLDHELCHVGGAACSDATKTCVPAAGNDGDLPAVLAICN